MSIKIRPFLRNIQQYFNLMADKEDEQQVVEQVSSGVVFRGTNLWILIFAILIASLGLNVNSTAVIIGAMLVSPLMGPIIGMGLAMGIGDYDLLRRALKNYGVATLISIVTATVYFFISPLGEARSELLARTSPTLYDVLIAFCGGAAGVLALTTKSKGQVIPGVAIATALMPPLCTAGYGLATAQWTYFFGAFYLYFINTVFIAVATFLGVKMLRFHSVSSLSVERRQYGRRLVMGILIVAVLPAAVMTWNIVRQNFFDRNVEGFVTKELVRSGTQIISSRVEHDTLRVVAVGRAFSEAELDDARSRMEYYKLKGYVLDVIQGSDESNLAAQLHSMSAVSESRIALLEGQLQGYTRYDTLSVHAMSEARPIFPEVKSLAVGRVGASTIAVVELDAKTAQESFDQNRFETWLRLRVQDENLQVFFE